MEDGLALCMCMLFYYPRDGISGEYAYYCSMHIIGVCILLEYAYYYWSYYYFIRDVFTVPCKQTIAFKLSSTCVSCIVKMINNDNGVVLGNDLEPMEVITNKNGYTLIGEAWSFGDTLEGKDNWTLTLMSSSPHLPTLVSGKDASIITSFHVVETKKYYLPNREFIIFR